MIPAVPRLPKHVVVFAPYVEKDGDLVSPHYDLAEYRAEIDGWMRRLGITWEWVRVTSRSLGQDLATVAARARGADVLVFNLCDGTAVDGYPGLQVVEGLQHLAVPFTGADAAFYRITTSKAAHKAKLVAAGVPTAPYVLLTDDERDLARAEREIGFPLFVKPDVSAGSYGIQVDSVCYDLDAARRKIDQLRHGLHGQHFEKGAILIEPYIAGREFTVLLIEDAAEPNGLYVLPPGHRAFDPRIPVDERFLAYERYWALPEAERPIPEGEPYYWYAATPEPCRVRIEEVARRAFRAVGGRSYARVDIREDPRSGEFWVLEVNAQCGLSSDDSSTVGSMIRLANVDMIDLVRRVLAHGFSASPR